MALPFDPGPRPAGVEALLGELPATLFDDRFHACCELVERYADNLALEIAGELALAPVLARGAGVDELAAERGFAAEFRPALAALLARLAHAGELVVEVLESPRGSPPRYRAARPLRASDRTALRAEGLALDPRLAATLDLLEAAAAAHVEVAHGRASGEQILLAPARIQLWLAYFAADNRVYAVSNEIAAAAASHRLRAGDGLRILEIGGGAGSAAFALLDELERVGRLADVARYDFTEPSPFFRRRGERELRARHPTLPFVFRGFDIDLPAAGQGDFGGYDLVFGVNVVHVARRLGETLGRLRELLAPGGVLVAGECCRLFPGQVAPADLVFQLLRGFTQVELDALRPHHGFLAPEAWRRALAASGFADVEVVPDLERVRDVYPRFYAGAVCGRRPPVESTRS
jgi:SAM-dependent methyltransferase